MKGPLELAAPEHWSVVEAAKAAVGATIETLEQIDMKSKGRAATVEICDENGVAYYVIDITKVRQVPRMEVN